MSFDASSCTAPLTKAVRQTVMMRKLDWWEDWFHKWQTSKAIEDKKSKSQDKPRIALICCRAKSGGWRDSNPATFTACPSCTRRKKKKRREKWTKEISP